MLHIITLTLSFIFLYLAIVWAALFYMGFRKKQVSSKAALTVVVPAFNEESTLRECVSSILASTYPLDKLKVIISDDGSTDDTWSVARSLEKQYDNVSIVRLRKTMGKSHAVNAALKQISTEYFGVLDADSFVHPDAIRNVMPYFSENVASVITSIRVANDDCLFASVQRIEYLMASFMRKILTTIGTLYVTPGALSVYRTSVIKDLGGFDDSTLTEDLEMGMRLKDKGYDIELAHESVTYTKVPVTMVSFWQQRIRWSRGFIQNHIRFKNMLFSRDHGVMGWFQVPLNILGPPLLVLSVLVILINTIQGLYEFIFRSVVIRDYFLSRILAVPTLKELVLGQNFRILLPIFLASVCGLFLLYAAHRFASERVKTPKSFIIYLIVLPYLTVAYWISAAVQEFLRMKRKW